MNKVGLGNRGRALVGVGILALVGGALLTTRADLVAALAGLGNSDYQVVDRWELRDGGYGMYIAVKPGLSREALERLGERLRVRVAGEPNLHRPITARPDGPALEA